MKLNNACLCGKSIKIVAATDENIIFRGDVWRLIQALERLCMQSSGDVVVRKFTEDLWIEYVQITQLFMNC